MSTVILLFALVVGPVGERLMLESTRAYSSMTACLQDIEPVAARLVAAGYTPVELGCVERSGDGA